MHAAYVRAWFLGGLVALLAAFALALPPATRDAAPLLLAAGAAYLALALSLGLLPAYARRDWPAPLHAWAALLLAALALPFLWHERLFAALLGVSLVLGALQPLALLLSPRWAGAREPTPHARTDRAALAGLGLSLAGVGTAGALLIALPRGLPNSALGVLLLAGALPAAFGALLFALPRRRQEPTPVATLAYAALGVLALAAGFLAYALHRPLAGLFRAPVAALALAFALGTTALLRLPRSARAGPLLAAALALEVLAALALLLATLRGAPNALLPVAYFAAAALALVLLAAALVVAAPLLLPGRVERARWQRWAGALLIASLFLYTPSLQYGRSVVPAILVGGAGLLALVLGLRPLATSAPRAVRRR